jgi:hypothetical protein
MIFILSIIAILLAVLTVAVVYGKDVSVKIINMSFRIGKYFLKYFLIIGVILIIILIAWDVAKSIPQRTLERSASIIGLIICFTIAPYSIGKIRNYIEANYPSMQQDMGKKGNVIIVTACVIAALFVIAIIATLLDGCRRLGCEVY